MADPTPQERLNAIVSRNDPENIETPLERLNAITGAQPSVAQKLDAIVAPAPGKDAAFDTLPGAAISGGR